MHRDGLRLSFHLMRIVVKLFAILRDRAGTGDLQLDLPPEATVQSASAQIAKRVPEIRAFLSRVAFAVNREYVKPDAPLRDGDELALIPPVSGG
jgi:molybdopterin converting factor subunit 1